MVICGEVEGSSHAYVLVHPFLQRTFTCKEKSIYVTKHVGYRRKDSTPAYFWSVTLDSTFFCPLYSLRVGSIPKPHIHSILWWSLPLHGYSSPLCPTSLLTHCPASLITAFTYSLFSELTPIIHFLHNLHSAGTILVHLKASQPGIIDLTELMNSQGGEAKPCTYLTSI